MACDRVGDAVVASCHDWIVRFIRGEIAEAEPTVTAWRFPVEHLLVLDRMDGKETARLCVCYRGPAV
jgi:hypothetical protein